MTYKLRPLYAFDVDDTLWVSGGPIEKYDIFVLSQTAILGLCGNWAMVTGKFPGWHLYFSFLGPLSMTKSDFLKHIATYVPASDYVMVGNDAPGQSQDRSAAEAAGWRFILENDFAKGQR